VDPSRRLRGRDALHAVGAALVAQILEDILSFDGKDDLLEPAEIGGAGVHYLDLPSAPFGVLHVHFEKVPSEQRSLISTGPGAYLHDDVAVRLLVLGYEGPLEFLKEALLLRRQFLEFVARELAEFVIGGTVGQHLLGLRLVALNLLKGLVLRNELAELPALLHQGRVARLVG
jgi:hypothetical protein